MNKRMNETLTDARFLVIII